MADIPNNQDENLETEDASAPTTDPADILEEAHARFSLAEDAWSDVRTQALDDLKFLAGDQWPQGIKADRERTGRPCLVVNRLPGITHQVTNDQRQNRPSIKVHPVDSAATKETAETIQGLIRHIEYNSNAEVAYDTAFESAAEASLGYFRIRTDFASPDSFEQEAFIDSIENPMSVYFDPYSRKVDGSDANWAFLTEDLSPEEYRRQFPDSKLAAPDSDWKSVGDRSPGWIKDGGARIAEYFRKEYRDAEICLLSTGDVVEKSKLGDFTQKFIQRQQMNAQLGASMEPVPTIVQERKTKIPVVKWSKINAIEVLEETEWPGSYIPIIPVYGARRFIDGKLILESVHRHAKDPQRMLNYWKSAETEAIALAPRAPWVGAEGQFEGHEKEWETANRENHAYLEYKPTGINGQPQPPPQRSAVEPAVQAITQATMGAADDIKATTGIYDPALGNISPDISGVAIQKRNSQSQNSTFHFSDNLKHSMKHAGRVLVEVIPKIYDTARATRIIGEDGTHKIVKINQPTGEMGEDGKPLIYDMSAGRYDVTIDVGPSFASKRQEASESLMQFSQAVPQAAQFCADLIARNMDWPGANEIADRLKKLLPPQLQDDGQNGPPLPPQVQAQMQQMNQMIEQLSQHLNEATKVIETKKLDLEHRERVEIMKLQVEAEIQMAKLGSSESIALLKAKFEEMEHRLAFLKMAQPIEAPQDFNPQEADGGNYAGVGHIGGTENLTGEASPGSPMEGQ